jgi:hypothetical protein
MGRTLPGRGDPPQGSGRRGVTPAPQSPHIASMIRAAPLIAPRPARRPLRRLGRTPERVVLLHGLGRTRASMAPLAWALGRVGFEVVNASYPSTLHPIEDLADSLGDLAGARAHPCRDAFHGRARAARVAWGQRGRPRARGHAGAPPTAAARSWTAWATSPPSARSWAPRGSNSAPRASRARLPVPLCEVGVIAGTRSLNPLYSRLIGGPSTARCPWPPRASRGAAPDAARHAHLHDAESPRARRGPELPRHGLASAGAA